MHIDGYLGLSSFFSIGSVDFHPEVMERVQTARSNPDTGHTVCTSGFRPWVVVVP